MSGTSVDGIDVALVRLAGSGPGMDWQVMAHDGHPFGPELRDRLLAMGEDPRVAVDDLARMQVRLAQVYADAIRTTLQRAGMDGVDLVGCHGQTVRHLPDPVPWCGAPVAATLQLGSGSTLANLLGVPVVHDFRSADMALGGQGAPLVPYADCVLLGDPAEYRVALNLGGIGNLTVLPAGAGPESVTAFDTGPGNMVSDALCVRLLGVPFDRDGAVAASGTPDEVLLGDLLADPWFRRPPPKSTGREVYGEAFVDRFLERASARGLAVEDQLATAAALTVDAVVQALQRFVRPVTPVHRVLVSGGGVRNRAMMARLATGLPGVRVGSTAEVGLDPDAKEAVAFAVLAHETFHRVPTGLPAVTGARRAAILGSLSFPA